MSNDPLRPNESAAKDELDLPEVISQIVAYDESLNSGKPIDPVSTTTLEEFPAGLRRELSEVFQCLDLLHDVRRRRAQHDTVTLAPEKLADGLNRDEIGMRPDQLRVGRFEIRDELGQGGHGVVFLAIDPVLRRRVALKVPRPEFLLSSEMAQRFVREAQATASLDHPNILKVYEAGLEGAVSYITQELCTGPSLAAWLREQPGGIDPALATEIARGLARGIQHAHDRGILHRDLKPTNVLLQPHSDDDSSTVDGVRCASGRPKERVSFAFTPKLCDFGIAKVLDEEHAATVTQTGAILGTIAYMAPEQAAGRTSEIGKATDVYSLGVILYELLAGRVPFESESRVDLLRKVVEDDPLPLRVVRPAIPADLEAICLKCLEKRAGDRYASAAELADDLDRFLNHEVVRARPVGRVARLVRQTRRRRVPASIALLTGALGFVLLLSIIGGLRWQARREQAETVGMLQQQHLAEEQAAFLQAYPEDMRRVYLDLHGETTGETDRTRVAAEAREILAKYVPQTGDADPRGFEWHYLWKILNPAKFSPPLKQLRKIPAHSAAAYFVVFSPDGKNLATSGADSRARVWDVETGLKLCELDGHERDVNCVEFSPDGQVLATASDDCTVRLWDAGTGRPQKILWTHTDAVVGVAFNPVNRHIAAIAGDGVLRVWELPASREIAAITTPRETRLEALAYSPDGRVLATGSNVDGLRLWDASNSYRPNKSFSHYPTKTEALCFSRDGQFLAIASDQDVRVIRVADGQLLSRNFVPGNRVRSLRFESDGRTLGIVGDQPSTGLLDWTTGEFWEAFGTIDNSWCTACSQDGRRIAVTDHSGSLRIWDSSARPNFYRTNVDVRPDVQMRTSLSPDGRNLAVATTSGDVTIWDIAASPPTRSLEIPPTGDRREVYDVAFAPDGRTIAVGMVVLPFDIGIRIFDTQTGREVLRSKTRTETDSPAPAQRITYSPDGSTLIVLHGTGGETGMELRIWDATTGQVRHSIPSHLTRHLTGPFPIAVSPTGGQLVTTLMSETSTIEVFRLSNSQRTAVWNEPTDPVIGLTYTRDAKGLVAHCGAGRVLFLDPETGATVKRLMVHGINAVAGDGVMALSPDQRTLALATSDRIVLAHPGTGTAEYVLPFPVPMIRVDDVSFSPDGKTLSAVATSIENKCGVYLWRAGTSD